VGDVRRAKVAAVKVPALCAPGGDAPTSPRSERPFGTLEERSRAVYERILSGIVVVDEDDRILAANAAFCALVGYSEEELVGASASALALPEDRRQGQRGHARLLVSDPHAIDTKRYRHKQGHFVWVAVQKSAVMDEDGALAYVVWSIQDVTHQQRLMSELHHRARHDPLTGLGNRQLFEEELAGMLRAPREEAQCAIVLLDLDNFRRVNDTLGHKTGDELLVAVAGRLQLAVRSTDVLSRLGGDEFLCLAPGVGTPAAAERFAARLLAVFDDPFQVAGQELEQRASAGITVLDPSAGRHDVAPESVDAVLRDADIALEEAKRERKGGAVLFTGGMREKVASLFELDQSLSGALGRGEISMHYQPVVDLRTKRTAGFEALMRWEHDRWGAVPPDTFIALAERNGHIRELGRFALKEATKEAATWPALGRERRPLWVAVNVSPRQLFAPGFRAEVNELLAASGLAPAQLVIEVTESTLLQDEETVSILFDDLCRKGVRVAIDDFGTGYSSLGRLAQCRPSILKIDRSFVSHAQPTSSSDAMLETILTLGHRLEMVVIAEGVTTEAQREHLVQLGCELGQGYLFSPARPADALDEWLHVDSQPGRAHPSASSCNAPLEGI
jgi:diguanylate cyclase (GGDEF)-like protein/PAS domain S-box-containing protein